MLIALLLIAIAAAGGIAITYLIDDDAPLSWRIAAGNIIGSGIFGTVMFGLTLVAGLNWAVVVIALVLAAAPVVLIYRDPGRIRADWQRAKSRTQGVSAGKLRRLAYYAFFFLLFFFFFDRAMLETPAGIFTGGSQNLGDLPFHLGAILSFTEANNFPPQNPSFAGARFSYPFIADLLSAGAARLGSGVRDAMFIQNLSWAFSLLIVLERFVLRLTESRLASRIAPPLLFFSGGLGFIWFLGDYLAQQRSFFDFLAHLPKDYTISEAFRWGNSMVVLFMTQRSLLLGMPLTLIVLGFLWNTFATEKDDPKSATSQRLREFLSALPVGLLAGMLPLIHLHSLAVLFVVGLFLLILRPEKWVTWFAFAAGVAVIAIPELVWSMAGSASETGKFFAWHFGWDKGEKNIVWFWLVNTGLVIPLLLAGVYLMLRSIDLPASEATTSNGPMQSRKAAKKIKAKGGAADAEGSSLITRHWALLFYLPFAFLFLVSNSAKLAPWEWDNIKVLIYWFVGSLPFIALAIAWLLERRNVALKVIAAISFVVLMASGALDVWRTVSGQINYRVFDKEAVEIAEQIRLRTPPDAMFLNAPTYNTAVVLTGRQSLMRYPGHLGSHGIDYGARESDVKRIYQGSPDAARLIEKYGISYVLVSPEERTLGNVNEQFFGRYPVVAEVGQYRVYKIR